MIIIDLFKSLTGSAVNLRMMMISVGEVVGASGSVEETKSCVSRTKTGWQKQQDRVRSETLTSAVLGLESVQDVDVVHGDVAGAASVGHALQHHLQQRARLVSRGTVTGCGRPCA